MNKTDSFRPVAYTANAVGADGPADGMLFIWDRDELLASAPLRRADDGGWISSVDIVIAGPCTVTQVVYELPSGCYEWRGPLPLTVDEAASVTFEFTLGKTRISLTKCRRP